MGRGKGVWAENGRKSPRDTVGRKRKQETLFLSKSAQARGQVARAGAVLVQATELASAPQVLPSGSAQWP